MKSVVKLNDTWKFWYAPRGPNTQVDEKNYNSILKEIGTVNTVDDFFKFYCFMKRPSEVPANNKIMFFRSPCQPLWEEWKSGGCWIVMFKRGDWELMNKSWENTLFACVGEQYDDSNVIGAVLSIREKHVLIEIWMRERNEELKIKVGEKMRTILGLDPQNLSFYFKDHDQSLTEKSTMRGAESYTFVRTPFETPAMAPILDKEKEEELQQFDLDS